MELLYCLWRSIYNVDTFFTFIHAPLFSFSLSHSNCLKVKPATCRAIQFHPEKKSLIETLLILIFNRILCSVL